MNNIENNKFRNAEQIDELLENYSFLLNKVLKAKKEHKCTTRHLAKAFNCSVGTISQFENRIKDLDFKMLYNYCGFFKLKLQFYIREMTYGEKMNDIF